MACKTYRAGFSGMFVFLNVLMIGGLLLQTACVSRYKKYRPAEDERKFSEIVETYSRRVNLVDPVVEPGAKAVIDVAVDEQLQPAAQIMFSTNRINASMQAHPISLDALMLSAIAHSSQIKVFSDLPLIRETSIQEASGVFDPRIFADGRYYDRDDPVGSTLITGGDDRFLEYDTRVAVGVRKKLTPGTEVYLTQEINRTRNNSEYLQPNPQAGARIVLGFVQPLLQGAGIKYNTSVMKVAVLDSEIARHEFVRQAEAHLLEVARSYWGLNVARGVYQAKQTAYDEAATVLGALESRGNLDAVRQQIMRARAVTAERRAALVRAESALRNGADRLVALVNDPALRFETETELIPIDVPLTAKTPIDLAEAGRTALANRAEVRQSYLHYAAAVVRREMSRKERLPSLNVFVEAYMAGLAADVVEDAWDDQFDSSNANDDGVSYMVGVRLEVPWGNNAAKAQNERRRLEARQVSRQLETTMETVMLDVKFSVREVDTAWRDLAAKHKGMQAAREDLENLKSRREAMFLGGDVNAVGYLNNLLDAQDRQMVAEERFLYALATYNVAVLTSQRAQGTLLVYEELETAKIKREYDDDRGWIESRKLPEYILRPATIEE